MVSPTIACNCAKTGCTACCGGGQIGRLGRGKGKCISLPPYKSLDCQWVFLNLHHLLVAQVQGEKGCVLGSEERASIWHVACTRCHPIPPPTHLPSSFFTLPLPCLPLPLTHHHLQIVHWLPSLAWASTASLVVVQKHMATCTSGLPFTMARKLVLPLEH